MSADPRPSRPADVDLELTVVMPCLNEADTLAVCLEKARRAMREADIRGEVVVADNGSTDGSVDIARSQGARVVMVEAKATATRSWVGSRPPTGSTS